MKHKGDIMQFKWNDTATELPAKTPPDDSAGLLGAYPPDEYHDYPIFVHVLADFSEVEGDADPLWIDTETMDCLDPPTAWAYIPKVNV